MSQDQQNDKAEVEDGVIQPLWWDNHPTEEGPAAGGEEIDIFKAADSDTTLLRGKNWSSL